MRLAVATLGAPTRGLGAAKAILGLASLALASLALAILGLGFRESLAEGLEVAEGLEHAEGMCVCEGRGKVQKERETKI
jgi:hypothetical protein